MAARKVLIGFAVLALGGGVLASVNAAPPCGRRACSDEAAASGLKGNARGACFRSLISHCQAGLCSCTAGSPPCSCVCGDGLCGPSENCSTCPQDCGTCPPCGDTAPACNGTCPPGEDCSLVRSTVGVYCACGPGPGCSSAPGTCGGGCPLGATACHLDTSNGFCLCEGPACGLAGTRCGVAADCCDGLCDPTGHCACLATGTSCTAFNRA